MMISETPRFKAAKRKVAAQERKLDAGKPNKYREALDDLCAAQRDMESARHAGESVK